MSSVRKAVITAAGKGSRHYPATAAVQKEMFPLVDRDGFTKPMIQIIAEEAIQSGIEEICIVTPPGGHAIYRDYFRESGTASEWFAIKSRKLGEIGHRLRYTEQSSPEGFGHAVFQARSFVGDEPFLLLLGDHVHVSTAGDRCARQLINVFETHSADAVSAVQLEVEQSLHLFGTIKGEPLDAEAGIFRALGIVEKPSIELARAELTTPGLPPGRYLAHFGMHVFSPRIFDALEYIIKHDLRDSGEIQLTAAQERLRLVSQSYLAAVIQGIRCDAGIPRGLIETQITLALHGPYAAAIRAALAGSGPARSE